MTVAELFVNIGVKGADSAGRSIFMIERGMKEVASTSLAAKAAIVGVMYGLERLMMNSAHAGTNLLNFASLTGLSTKELQQWQYAARQAGVQGEDMASSVRGVQNAMSDMLMGKGAPSGMGLLATKVGFDPAKARDTFYVLKQLQQFAKEVPADIGNAVLKSFGIGDAMIAGMRRNAFNEDVFKKAPTYSEGEIGSLNKVGVGWSNVGNKIEMAMGHLTAKHGMNMVNDIGNIVGQIMKLADALTTLAEKLKIFELIGKVFEGWGLLFGLIGDGIDKVSGSVPGDKKGGKNWSWDSMLNKVGDATIGKAVDALFFPDMMGARGAGSGTSDFIKPKVGAPAGGGTSNQKNEIHIHTDTKKPKEHAQIIQKEINSAYRQMNQAQVG